LPHSAFSISEILLRNAKGTGARPGCDMASANVYRSHTCTLQLAYPF